MEAEKCESCGSESSQPLGCQHCGLDKSTAWLCGDCARLWTCPTCTQKPWASYALTFDLDSDGLPQVVSLDSHGAPPAGAVKIDPSQSDDQIFRLYLAFRRAVLERLGVDEMSDPFLAEYGAKTRDETGHVNSSGGDSQKTGLLDTFVLPPPRPLRVMSWNLQDLGGGPSRNPIRSEETIRRIARVIAEVNPDICALLEIKLTGRLPPKPQPPPRPRRTRSTSGKSELDKKFAKRQQKYEEDLEAWEEAKERLRVAQRSGTPPGAAEVAQIMSALASVSSQAWSCLLDTSMYTENETYAFIHKADITPVNYGLLDRDTGANALYWPEQGYRAPARVTFRLSGSRVGRPRGKLDEDWELDFIAFHAPAPRHGDKVAEAIQKFALVDWPRETIFAGDFNVDTEVGDINRTAKYQELIDEAGSDEEAEELFDKWAELTFNETLDENRELFEGLFGAVNSELRSIFGDETWLAGWDIERTSLRTKISAARGEHYWGGAWQSTLAFQNAAYDKIVLLTPKPCDRRLLQAKSAFAYPMFERFLPSDLRGLFRLKVIDDVAIQSYREDVIDAGSGAADKKLQRVLDGVKEVSDPVVLDLEIHPA